jgi:hypothetical protein
MEGPPPAQRLPCLHDHRLSASEGLVVLRPAPYGDRE